MQVEERACRMRCLTELDLPRGERIGADPIYRGAVVDKLLNVAQSLGTESAPLDRIANDGNVVIVYMGRLEITGGPPLQICAAYRLGAGDLRLWCSGRNGGSLSFPKEKTRLRGRGRSGPRRKSLRVRGTHHLGGGSVRSDS